MICAANGRVCACHPESIKARDCAGLALIVAARLETHPISRVPHAAALRRAQVVREKS